MRKGLLFLGCFITCSLYAIHCAAQEQPMVIISRGIPFISLEEKQQAGYEPAGVNLSGSTGINSSFRYAAATALPGVVHIIATYEPGFKWPEDQAARNGQGHPGVSSAVLEGGTMTGSASGVIITPDGYIVTNYHVVNHAESLEVVLENKRSFKAYIIGMDSLTDIALLKISGRQLPFVRFGSMDSVAVGDWVLAIGSPMGMDATVTAGIISAKSRIFTSEEEQGQLSSYIQTDAVMNSGNSGGALVDTKGKLIGINIGILTPTGNFAGYSFAIPVEVVKKVCNDLLREGRTRRASLGVYITNATGMPGVLVYKLVSKGAAEKGGIEVHDIIKEIDNGEIRSVGDIQQILILHHPGDKVVLKVLRNGKLISCDVMLSDISG
ncbi:S1C family serine protease [Chitinophaga sp.]|uniref:S1C family serine protease n=1 Tax=Chitinophaga sp. TaxID=1869181 RepID=UPI002C6A672F|nr:trypsin-like peptidase domain-containing protein [Chitinophaga sp.]HWV64864.1 trypsin-like peptidase domain-containing protein [Chitinophaga sp.]